MKKSFISVLLTFLSFIGFAQDSISVLFVGNSYTYVNDLPTVFTALSNSLGKTVNVDSKTNGGFTFQNQLDDPLTYSKIHSKPWDFVVLQGQSQEPSFPYDQVNSQTLPPAKELADSVYANKYCSQVLYFMTWGRENGDPQWDSINTFYKMNERLRNAYLRITDSAQASVAPVGVAWKYIRDTYPTINLYSGDGSHPSMEGTYLAACTFYASLFRETPVGALYFGGLNPTTALNLQQAAEIAVLDSMDTWHLRPGDEIAIADFSLDLNGSSVQFNNESWRSQTFEWNFGDGNSSTDENPEHTYSQNATYSVQLIAINECGTDTVQQEVIINSLGIDEQSFNDYSIIKLSDEEFKVNFLCNESIKASYILNSLGQIQQNFKVETLDDCSLSLSSNGKAKGIYYLVVRTTSKEFSIKLPFY